MSIADPEFGGDTNPIGVCNSCGHKIGLYSDCWIRDCNCGRCKSRVNAEVVNFCDKFKNWNNHRSEYASTAAFILEQGGLKADELRDLLFLFNFNPKKPQNFSSKVIEAYKILADLLHKIQVMCPVHYEAALTMFSAFIDPGFCHKDTALIYTTILQFCILDDKKKFDIVIDSEMLERCYLFISQKSK